ncbi:MAG: metal-dependent hydrolase [Ferruginibacter sp.]
MDSLTHIALGACVGEAFFEKGYGKKAMLWGALAQSIPDIDFVASLWSTVPEGLLAHRGFTHSILFALIVIPLFALAADKVHKWDHVPYKKWLLFFAVEVFLHLFVDGYNNYGVGWFEPFSHQRYSFNAIYVADFFFSIWPAIAFVALLILNRYSLKRKFWWRFGLLAPFIYLCYCTFNKIKISHDVKEIFAEQNIPHERYFTTPAPLQNWLWFVVAGDDKGYYAGFRSVFDSKKHINFQYFPRNDSLLRPVKYQDDIHKLTRFSQGFYTVEKWRDTLVFNDLRFGQNFGWDHPKEKFVFYYFIEYPKANRMVVQRGRVANWSKEQIAAFWRRIKGN